MLQIDIPEGYTRHGHHVAGAPKISTDNEPPKARCGGPLLCDICAGDSLRYFNKTSTKKENNMSTTAAPKPTYVKHKPYQDRVNHRQVRAIRVTAANFIKVANWSGGLAISKVDKNGDISRQRVRVAGLIAQIGDFVVRVEDGKDEKGKPVYKFFRVKDDIFEATYKPVK